MTENGILELLQCKYLLKTRTASGSHILYNRTNGSIIELSNLEYKKLENGTGGEFPDLLKCVLDSGVLDFGAIRLCRDVSSVFITIEMSMKCNLKCRYCYQSNVRLPFEFSDYTEASLYRYVEKVCSIGIEKKEFVFCFIGGEPLLHRERVFRMIENLGAITEKHGKKACFSIDTNGTIDVSQYVKYVKRLSLSISLTSKHDHNAYRVSENFDSFETIVFNLKKYQPNPFFRISIRYNVNHENMLFFDSFVSFVKENLPIVSEIHTAYTDNYGYNKDFNNQLSVQEYIAWNSSTAIDVLVQHGYPICWSLPSSLRMCSAYQPYSCKIHCDGSITLCDGMDYQQGLTIGELENDIEALERKYQIKGYDPTNDLFCRECSRIVQCQGRVFCRGESSFCNYQRMYDESLFLSKYVEYCHKGMKDLFVGM